MSRGHSEQKLKSVCHGSAAWLLLCLSAVAMAQQLPPAQPDDEPLFAGAGSCARCHETPSTTDINSGVTARVCLTEWQTWKQLDRHAKAYDSLLGPRGQQMAQLLQIEDVTAPSAGCVQCHTTSYAANACVIAPADACVPEGVGCEACHGPSSTWRDQHWISPTWREADPQRKSQTGWIDVRSPIVRAEVCLSCHVGNSEQGRLITHDMYAAGHPPLAGFEIESFVDKMPRHWRYPHERADAGGAVYERTRNVLIGSVVALRMAVELAVADATAPVDDVTAQADKKNPRWPELARLDCFAYHHDLVEPGWRQFRPVSTAAPGRAPLAVGCVPLVSVAAEVAGGPEADLEVGLMLARMGEPFATNPFGDPQQLAKNGAEVVASCRSLESQLTGMDYRGDSGRSIARGALRAIGEHAAAEYRDYDMARQLFGAWRVIYEELRANGAIQLSAASQAEVDRLFERIDELDIFVLERERIRPPCDPPALGEADATPTSVDLSVKTGTNRANYNPATFAQLMVKLNELTAE